MCGESLAVRLHSWHPSSLSLSLSLSPCCLTAAALKNVRDVASSLQHGAGGRSLMEIWGIYPTFCVYLCLSVRGSAADICKGTTSTVRGGCKPSPPPHSPLTGTRHTSPQIPVRHVWGQKDEKHVPDTSFGKDPGRQGGEKGSPLTTAQSLRGGTRWVVLFQHHAFFFPFFFQACLGLIDLDTSCTLSLINPVVPSTMSQRVFHSLNTGCCGCLGAFCFFFFFLISAKTCVFTWRGKGLRGNDSVLNTEMVQEGWVFATLSRCCETSSDCGNRPDTGQKNKVVSGSVFPQHHANPQPHIIHSSSVSYI